MRLGSLWLAFRPKTLTAAVVPVVVGHSLVVSKFAEAHLWITLCCLGSAVCIQLATNFLNDAIDFRKGADTADRLGPRRVTQSGLMSERSVFISGIVFLLLASLLGIPLVLHGGWPIVALGVVSLFLAYGYTGGPFPLAYLGLGDIFVILFFGLFAVGGVYYLHTFTVTAAAMVAGLQVGLLATVLIAINNLRDRTTDVCVDKKTLAVRFGESFAKAEIFGLIVLAFGLNFFYRGQPWVWLTLLSFPLAGRVLFIVFNRKDALNSALGIAGGLHLVFGVLLSIGLGLK